jgi:hypothetical protein
MEQMGLNQGDNKEFTDLADLSWQEAFDLAFRNREDTRRSRSVQGTDPGTETAEALGDVWDAKQTEKEK